jgi:glucan biosynthesis protein
LRLRGLSSKKINKKLQKKPKKEYYYTKILKEIYRQIKAKHKYAIQEMKREPWELRFFKVVELYKEKITKLRFVDSTARSDVRYIRM